MIKSIYNKALLIKGIAESDLIIFIASTIIADLYNQFWGFIYAFGNI